MVLVLLGTIVYRAALREREEATAWTRFLLRNVKPNKSYFVINVAHHGLGLCVYEYVCMYNTGGEENVSTPASPSPTMEDMEESLRRLLAPRGCRNIVS